jgi:uncharacterized membrane protein YsdA (DUF1294 family)
MVAGLFTGHRADSGVKGMLRMSDQQITCVTCGRIFTWPADDQRSYAEHGYQPPKHCRDCRAHRRAERQPGLAPVIPVEPVPIPKELRAAADRLSGRVQPSPRPTQKPVSRPAPQPARSSSRAADLVFMWVSITVGLALILTVALWLLGADVVVAWLIAITGITFLTYGYDKAVASSKATRVPEKALLALALVGGTLGAWAGMSAFHHKTAKESFRFKFVLVIIIQVVLLVVYFYFR